MKENIFDRIDNEIDRTDNDLRRRVNEVCKKVKAILNAGFGAYSLSELHLITAEGLVPFVNACGQVMDMRDVKSLPFTLQFTICFIKLYGECLQIQKFYSTPSNVIDAAKVASCLRTTYIESLAIRERYVSLMEDAIACVSNEE